MGHSGSSEPGPSAEHPRQDLWRNTVGAQQEGCTIAFDLEDFVVSKPSRNAPNLSFRSIFCAMKKLHKTCDPAKTAGTRFFPGYYSSRNRYSRHGGRMRPAHTFNHPRVCWIWEEKHGFWARSGGRRNIFDTAHHIGSNAVEKHVDLKPV